MRWGPSFLTVSASSRICQTSQKICSTSFLLGLSGLCLSWEKTSLSISLPFAKFVMSWWLKNCKINVALLLLLWDQFIYLLHSFFLCTSYIIWQPMIRSSSSSFLLGDQLYNLLCSFFLCTSYIIWQPMIRFSSSSSSYQLFIIFYTLFFLCTSYMM